MTAFVLPAAADRWRLLAYAGVLMLLVNFAAPNGGLVGIPVVFFLKNRLGLTAHQLAVFNLWIGAPLYASFVFGFLRDRWSPFGAGDRGHFALFGMLTAAIYAAIAFMSPTYGLLLAGLLLATASIQTASSSAAGLFSGLGQQYLMPGGASTVLNIAAITPSLIGFMFGGMLSDLLEGSNAVVAARSLFLFGAALMAAVALIGGLGPPALYTAHAERPTTTPLADVRRLVRHWPVWPPVIIMFLWNFAPGAGTVLQYHLANALHASDSQVGWFYAIFWGSFLPTFMLYGWLCQRVRLSRLLFWGTIFAVPQWVPILFVHSPAQALLIAVPIGLMGGMATGAYVDLAIRSCPKGLQGTMMMLVVTTTFFVAGRFGDLWGTKLYEQKNGFLIATIATTVVYALILPMLLLVPARLTSTSDGQTIDAVVAV